MLYCMLAKTVSNSIIYIYPKGARCLSQDNKSAQLCHESVCKWGVQNLKIKKKICCVEAF